MAIARLHGGPLDGQIIPLENTDQQSLILPYSETQLTYLREGAATHTGDHDGPTEVSYRFEGSSDDITSRDD